jgi:hypothetical protein
VAREADPNNLVRKETVCGWRTLSEKEGLKKIQKGGITVRVEHSVVGKFRC